jgi:ABC-2 type transport system permease protein
MPIHAEGYRPYRGTRGRPGQNWLVITTAGVRAMAGRRLFLGLLLVSWAPFLVRAVQIYAAVNFPQASFLDVSARMFRDFLEQQSLSVFVITVWVGAGLIANDLRSNALQIYLSKPLTQAEYVAGKLGILFLLLLLVTWVPAMLLLVTQVLLTGSLAFVAANLYLIPAITIVSLVSVLLSSFTILALSSFSRSARFVAVTYAGLLFFTQALFAVVRGATGRTTLSWLSVPGSVNQIGDAVFRLPHRFETPVAVSIVTVAVLIGLSVLVLRRRVRAVEVVA